MLGYMEWLLLSLYIYILDISSGIKKNPTQLSIVI